MLAVVAESVDRWDDTWKVTCGKGEKDDDMSDDSVDR